MRCDLCGHEHDPGSPHIFGKRADFEIGAVGVNLEPKKTDEIGFVKPVRSAGYDKTMRWRARNRDKYRTYQRELMRKRRARV